MEKSKIEEQKDQKRDIKDHERKTDVKKEEIKKSETKKDSTKKEEVKTEITEKKKPKRKIKRRIINAIFIVFMLGCVGLLIYSGYHILIWGKENKKVDEQIDEIEDVSEVVEQDDSDNTELINPVQDKSDPYWDYIKVKLIDVDFSELKEINKDVAGWIQVAGTNINYPFVQTSNNSYYLTHQFDKKKNSAGWVFMDYRNNKYDFDRNTILYAHGRVNKTMFGSLRNVIKKSWYNNKDNYIVKISTETENTLWQVFSTYRIKTTNDYLQIDFSNDELYLAFLNKLKDRSVHDYNVTLTPNDKIITLSTCHNETDKIVLHAKLIKRESKITGEVIESNTNNSGSQTGNTTNTPTTEPSTSQPENNQTEPPAENAENPQPDETPNQEGQIDQETPTNPEN